MSDIFKDTRMAQVIKLVHDLQNPKALARANMNPVAYFAEHGIVLPPNLSYDIHINDEKTYYFVLLADKNPELTEEVLALLAAGKTVLSSLATLTTFSTTSTVGYCLGSFGSILTLSSLIDTPG